MNQRVCVPLAHFMFRLKKFNLLHMLLAKDFLQLSHPEVNWPAVLLLDRRKV